MLAPAGAARYDGGYAGGLGAVTSIRDVDGGACRRTGAGAAVAIGRGSQRLGGGLGGVRSGATPAGQIRRPLLLVRPGQRGGSARHRAGRLRAELAHARLTPVRLCRGSRSEGGGAPDSLTERYGIPVLGRPIEAINFLVRSAPAPAAGGRDPRRSDASPGLPIRAPGGALGRADGDARRVVRRAGGRCRARPLCSAPPRTRSSAVTCSRQANRMLRRRDHRLPGRAGVGRVGVAGRRGPRAPASTVESRVAGRPDHAHAGRRGEG